MALGRWARCLLCHLLAVWCVLTLGAGVAGAAPAGPEEPAPMCDPDGASVAAKDDIPEVDRGRLEALSCDAQLLIVGWRLDSPELGRQAARVHDADPSVPPQPVSPPPVRYDAAHELGVPFPERAAPLATVFHRGEGLAQRRGHARGLFRPPLSRS